MKNPNTSSLSAEAVSALPADNAADRRRAPKGRQTRSAIVDAALSLASQMGLEGLSIGAVAEATGMSKSGVFAHFGSREELQISVIREYYERFEAEVFLPALKTERGLPRLTHLFDNWVLRTSAEIDSGCIFISGAVEFDDRPGAVRDALAQTVAVWQQAVCTAVAKAQEARHLSQEVAAADIAFEIHGLILALHYEARFMRAPHAVDKAKASFARLMSRYHIAPQTLH